MNQPTSTNSKTFFEELPFHKLIEIDPTTLNEDQLRQLVSVIQERRQSSQKRRSQANQAAKKLSGKSFDADRFA